MDCLRLTEQTSSGGIQGDTWHPAGEDMVEETGKTDETQSTCVLKSVPDLCACKRIH